MTTQDTINEQQARQAAAQTRMLATILFERIAASRGYDIDRQSGTGPYADPDTQHAWNGYTWALENQS